MLAGRRRREEQGMQWYWCLRHGRVEKGDGCANKDRMGPYATEDEAAATPERTAARTAAEDARDLAEDDWGTGWGDGARGDGEERG
jgi:hypothetical protein